MSSEWSRKRSQAGMVLIYVTMIVALAAIIMSPLLRFVYAGHQTARIREERMLELYAADAGIEDAMYQVMMEDKFETLGSLGYGEGETYYPETPDPWNDRAMDVEVTKIWLPEDLGVEPPDEESDKSEKLKMVGLYTFVEYAAGEERFEDGWGGGSGWAGSWDYVEDYTQIVEDMGSQRLSLTGTEGYAARETSLTHFYEPRLKMVAKASSFESGDWVKCLVSTEENPTVGDWQELVKWEDGSDTDVYEIVDVDASAYPNETHFWVAYESNLSGAAVSIWDDFDTCGETGGSGWDGDWGLQNRANIGSDGGPYGGSGCHLRLRGGWLAQRGLAVRRVSGLAGWEQPQLQFYVKRTNNWESTDRAYVWIQSNEMSWERIRSWSRSSIPTSYGAMMEIDLSPYVTPSTTWIEIRFGAGMNSSYEHVYFDNVEIVATGGGSFYVDNLWIGNEVDSYTIEIAYREGTDSVWLDALGVWMPPRWSYDGVVEWVGLFPDEGPAVDPVVTPSFAGGSILRWEFTGIDLAQPWGARPVVSSLTFRYREEGDDEDDEGAFIWLEAHPDGGDPGTYLSWDTGFEIYRATSEASHEIWGSNTRVESYTSQGEIDKRGVVAYGNYRATGAPLLIDANTDDYEIKEWDIDPADCNTWWCSTDSLWACGDPCAGILYTGSAMVDGIPDEEGDNTEVIAAWLYWSGFLNNDDWDAAGEEVDREVQFRYPKVYGPETLGDVGGGYGYPAFVVDAYASSTEPIVDQPRKPIVWLTPTRVCGEVLGEAVYGNETFFTEEARVEEMPEPKVYVGIYELLEDEFTIDYGTGNVTLSCELAGTVTIDHSVAGSDVLSEDDYDIEYDDGQVTITNECLAGSVAIQYWASHWETVNHNAEDRYGTELPPVEEEVQDADAGWTYACFADVTDVVKGTGLGDYAIATGNGEYAVHEVLSTKGVEGEYPQPQSQWNQKCFSGWSLVVLYESQAETAHQFYLYDPIHSPYDPLFNPDGCRFQVAPNHEVSFTIEDFYPPEGTADGRLTYFAGEGDEHYTGEYVQFRAHSEAPFPTPTSDNCLSGENNPWNRPMNAVSTTGERGVDIDTCDVLEEVGDATAADVRLKTSGDRWYLVYIVLSFKTMQLPKSDYFFNVAAVTYSYELGTSQ